MTKEHFIHTKLATEFNIDNFFIIDHIAKIENINKRYSTAGQIDAKEIILKEYLEKFAINKLSHTDYFIRDWKSYIQTGIFSEN